MPNFMRHTNKTDAKIHFQPNLTDAITTVAAYTTTVSYISTTTTPKGLSTTAVVFIVIAAVVIVIILCGLFWYLYRRRKHRSTTSKPVAMVALPPAAVVNPAVAPPKHRPLHGRAPSREPKPTRPLLSCMKPLCRECLNELNVKQAYFDSRYDKCFCSQCHDPSNADGKCGHHCGQLHGWVRFGLRINKAHQKQWNIFREWKTSYYGTSADRLASILSSRFLPFDGDQLENGTTFVSGHPDPNQCITSPSIVCASQPKFTARSHFRARDGTRYDIQFVLQCKQKPDTYTIHGNAKSFHTTEWTTGTRCCSIPFGLFVRLRKQRT